MDCQSHGAAEPADKAPPRAGETPSPAVMALRTRIDRSLESAQAALTACIQPGGDRDLADLIAKRVRDLQRQRRLTFDDVRGHLRDEGAKREEALRKRRVEAVASRRKEQELQLTVKLRQAEADIAKACSKEAATAAKAALAAAKDAKTAKSVLDGAERAENERMQRHFAALLTARLRSFFADEAAGVQRRERLQRQAAKIAAQRTGLRHIDAPSFWPVTTVGMIDPLGGFLRHRLRGKSEILYASPEFCWVIFGRAPTALRQYDCPRAKLRKLMEEVMPGYFDVLGSRYGLDALFSEAGNNLDYAFVAANYRYSLLVGTKYYRDGICDWPPPADWYGAWKEPLGLACGPAAPA